MTAYLAKNNELEAHFCTVGENCVFLAKTSDSLDDLLERSVFQSAEFQTLPKKSQIYVTGYIHGVRRGTARLLGEQAAPHPIGSLPAESIDITPGWVTALQANVSWHQHPNGGGWVSSTAYVEGSASVSGKAAVYGDARVYDRTRIYGSARVHGAAECYGAPHIHGKANVGGNARIFDGAKILGEATITGSAQVGGFSVIRGTTVLVGGEFIDQTISETPKSTGDSGAHKIELPAGVRGVGAAE